ncbi:hypothetical protein HX870_27800 [Pseudomonas gingeri]|uniref:hypothetical protein n=1 Tax=Pseudomonas gingeri TaxID=117681 RepID=UPI0015A438CC|nr:hypothetical protein [Pseudomonas gingeri]NWA28299.1 hypothetical protein [Pseudomonas gingeri]NWD71410.1 hypothetical protein [Pseudomonas gingeri]NWD72856.1 hypothetical protein [Pseudomonas gingeri]
MINLNASLIPSAFLLSSSEDSGSSTSRLSSDPLLGDDSGTNLLKDSLAANDKAAKDRVKKLRAQIEQLQQKLRRANAHLAATKSGHHPDAAARDAAVQPAKAQVAAIGAALNGTSTALFMAEKLMAGMVDTTA